MTDFVLQLGSSLRSEDDEVGFSLRLGPESVLGLDALSVNDRTLWTSKINEACSNFEETEKKFLTRQKSGKYSCGVNCYQNSFTEIPPLVEETETKESKGRLLLIVVKGEHIKEDGGKQHAQCAAYKEIKVGYREGFPLLLPFLLCAWLSM